MFRVLLGTALIFASVAHAQGPMGEFLERVTGLVPLNGGVGYRVASVAEVKTNDADKSYSAAENQLDGTLRLGDHWAAIPRNKLRNIASNAQIPGSNRKLPAHLWDTRLQGAYATSTVGGSGLGTYFEIGQATDALFMQRRNSFYRLTPYLMLGPEARNSLVAFMDFSNARVFANYVPIPGFSYSLRLSPFWGASLGFPRAAVWIEPFTWLKFSASIEPFFQVETKIENHNERFLDFYTEFVSVEENYRLTDRLNDADQLIYRKLALKFGTFKVLGPFEARAGVAWEMFRSYMETANFLRDRKDHLLKLENGLLTSLEARLAF